MDGRIFCCCYSSEKTGVCYIELTSYSTSSIPTEPPKLIVNEKRYGRKSKPDNSASEDQYSADEESSFLESRPESRASDITPIPHDPPQREPMEVIIVIIVIIIIIIIIIMTMMIVMIIDMINDRCSCSCSCSCNLSSWKYLPEKFRPQ